MKKKILFFVIMVATLACLLAFSVSAAASDYFGQVEIIDLDNDGVSDISVASKITNVIASDNADGVPSTESARVKLNCTCEKGSHTFPAYYICAIDKNLKTELYSFDYGALNALREEYCGSADAYTITSLAAFEFPNGITSAYNGLFGKKTATSMKYVSFAKCTTMTTVRDAAGGNNWFEATNIEEVDFGTALTKIPSYFCYNCDSLKSVVIPDQVTTIAALAFYDCNNLEKVSISRNSELTALNAGCFKSCTSLEAFYIPKGITSFGVNGSGSSPIDGCKKLYFVSDPSETTKPKIYYFPTTVTSIVAEAFKNCTNLNDVIVFHEGITSVDNGWAFCNANAITIVFLGDMVDVGTTGDAWTKNKAVYFCNENDTSTSSFSCKLTNQNFVFCNAGGQHLAEPKSTVTTPADCLTNEKATEKCFCGAEMGTREVEGTKLGHNHNVAEGATVLGITYAKFDENGYKTVKCSRCDVTDESTVANPILNGYKGFSVPETASYKGITFGYDIDKTALSEYEAYNAKLEMGFVVAINALLGENNPLNADGSVALANGIIKATFANNETQSSYNRVDFVLKGDIWDTEVTVGENKMLASDVEFLMCAYVIANGNVSYINKNTTSYAVELAK